MSPPAAVRSLIIGGGISGLSAATFMLHEEPDANLLVLEAGEQPGGNLRTTRIDGRCIDHAANGWLDTEPAVGRLLDHLGLQAEVVKASDRYKTRWILADGEMQPAPLSPPALLRSRLLTWGDRLRALWDLFARRGASGIETPEADESVGDFVRRRLGQAFVDNMVGPMVAGIFAADPDRLSLRAALPRMFELERDHRSLLLAMLRLRRGGAPSGGLQTLASGAGRLSEQIATRLGDRLITNAPVEGLEKRRSSWRVHTGGGFVDCERLLLACPASTQARLLRGLDPEATAALDTIASAPATVVVTGWPEGTFAREPEGFGVLVGRKDNRSHPATAGVLGTVFTSQVFPDQARPGEHLLRTIVGGGILPEAATLPDDLLMARVRAHLELCLGAAQGQPSFLKIIRHPLGIPQLEVGHRKKVAAARGAEARHSGLILLGNHLDGLGVKDCVRAGEAAAARALRS